MLDANKSKLQNFVDVRLEAAKGMPPADAVWFLRKWADHVEKQFQELARYVDTDANCPDHLRGLVAVDLIVAEGRLSSQATRYEAAVKAALAA